MVLVAILVTACGPAGGSQPAAVITSPTPTAPATPPAAATPPSAAQVLPDPYFATYDFVSPTLGWALVAKRHGVLDISPAPSPDFWVFKTSDGAMSWHAQFTGTVATFLLGGFQFFDQTNGILDVTGLQKSLIYRTADGGEHWSAISFPNNTVGYSFADPMHGWAYAWHELNGPATHPDLLSTVDGGQTWTPRSWLDGSFWPGNGIPGEQHFRRNGEGWFGGLSLKAMAYSTPDGGITWRSLAIPLAPGLFPTPSPDDPNFDVNVVLLPGAGVLAVVGGPFGWERAFTSFDGGATWKLVSSPPDLTPIASFLYVDAKHWWAMGTGSVYRTSDAGQTWKRVEAPALLEGWKYSPHVIDSGHAWAELLTTTPTVQGALVLSSDGGVSWTPANVPQPS
jgi:hypothetical protein